MKYDAMTTEQMQEFVRRMDKSFSKLTADRQRILSEIKGMQDRNEILSWEEIASGIAYPKAMSDKERISGGNVDNDKLLGQLEKINKIYMFQMEGLFEELAVVETKIAKIGFVNRCIGRLEDADKRIIEEFTRKDITYESASQEMHMTRNTIYKLQKKALEKLVGIYSKCCLDAEPDT